MAKSSPKKKAAKKDNSNLLMALKVAGILLIAVGVLSLLAVVSGVETPLFLTFKEAMQGFGGGLCVGVSILIIWIGVLVALSSERRMPIRPLILVSVMFLAVLGVLNLLSKIGTNSLMEYLIDQNQRTYPPVMEPAGFGSMFSACYAVCSTSGAFGGALGMLLAWPAWTFLGTALGTVVLCLICLVCVLMISRFDLAQMMEAIRSSTQKSSQRRSEKQALREQQRIAEEQKRQAEEAERLRQSPAYQRRAQQPAQQPVQQMAPECAPVADTAQMFAAPSQGEIYDEIIVPREKQLPWRRHEKKAAAAPAAPAAYQTSMTFTPSEVAAAPAEMPVDNSLNAPRKKAMQKVENIRKRREELEAKIESDAAARDLNAFAPAVRSEAEPETFFAPVESAFEPAEEPEEDLVLQPLEMPAVEVEKPAPMERPAAPARKTPAAAPGAETIPYAYPSIDLLNAQQRREAVDTRAMDAEGAAKLEKTLESFGIPARVQRVTHGPAVTRYELGLVSSGINVKRITSIADNIALEMASNGGVRIEIPIPGTNLFGIEAPNREIQSVTLSEVLMSPEMRAAKSPLAVALGKDIAGRPVICDIAKMPHLLIAGQTGSGKSVCINTIINSILFRSSPEEVRMIMIDPKVVELQCYNVVPHLLIPVVSDPHKAAGALQWAVAEMLDRYHKMQVLGVRELSAYNAKLPPDEPKLPRIVIIIDELADLMLACKKEVEESIIRIAQLARAAGIHMIVATQRPTKDVVTGLIKANIPSRIAFAVSSGIDSRVILDQNGAEKLLGKGDMFYFPTGNNALTRVQGCFLSDAEIERVVDYIGEHSRVEFDPDVIEALDKEDEDIAPMADADECEGVDDRLAEAIEMVISDGQASISMLQRRMKIGYARAGRLIDDMAARGIVSKSAGSKPREVLISWDEYERIKDSLGI